MAWIHRIQTQLMQKWRSMKTLDSVNGWPCNHNPRLWLVMFYSKNENDELQALEFRCSVCHVNFWLAIEMAVLNEPIKQGD